jgi:hypothetical protein
VQTASTSPDALAERLFAAALGAIELLAAYLGADRQPVASKPPQPTEYVAAVNELTRVGTLWQVSCAGISVHLPDRRDFPALDLATSAPAARHRTTRRAADLGADGIGAEGALGDRIDAQARAAYTARVRELQAELDDADAVGDPERGARAQQELDFLTGELTAAYGLRGPPPRRRPRREGALGRHRSHPDRDRQDP